MKKKQVIWWLVVMSLSLLLVTACGNQQKDSSKNSTKASTKTSESTTKTESTKTSKTKTSAEKEDNSTEDNQAMNLKQIEEGNYSSILGTWHEVGSARNHVPGKTGTQYEPGGSNTLSVTENEMTSLDVSVSKKDLTDNNGTKELQYKEEDGVLIGSLVNPSVSINWSVSFYPVGTTMTFPGKDHEEEIKEDTIVFWTSNNNYTIAFAREAAADSQETVPLNLQQLETNDFTSLVGTWKNNATGDVMIVTNETEDRPEGSIVSSEKGAVIEGTVRNGYPSVIASGSITNGYMQGAYGTFDPSIQGSGFAPIVIVPANVKYTDADETDYTKDRLIKGGIQSDISQNTYYRE